MQIHPRKMKVYQIERNKKVVKWEPIKFPKKKNSKKKELTRLKIQKGGLSKN